MTDEGFSDSVHLVWGKTSRDRGFVWMPLWRHLADSADIAGRLWDLWLPAPVRRRIGAELPGGEADGRRLARWLAGVHDIGKATPAFAYQVPYLREKMSAHGFVFQSGVKDQRKCAPHAAAGHVVLLDWLTDQHDWDGQSAGQLAVVVGSHHGVPPTDADIDKIRTFPYLIGPDGLWADVRDELLNWMTRRVGVTDRLPEWRDVELSQPVQVVLTAIVIVADWLASNEDLFPYGVRLEEPLDRLDRAWDTLDLPTPWQAIDVTRTPAAALFSSRFALPAGAQLHPVQSAVVAQAQEMPVPGMLIVEAPMGEGKTEAALAAVEILASRTGAGGCFIALPTRATSDAMFSRVMAWLEKLPDADPGRGARDANLAHSKAWLNDEFSRIYRGVLPSAIGTDQGGAEVAVHRWLAGRKRGLLSSFVIGTIDQLLFAALKARHVMLRHLGLAGKVVVIDEAHAYDVYMSRYLDRALEWMGAYGVPVVVLSATLPAHRRAEMMRAYDNGRLGPPQRRRPRRWSSNVGSDISGSDDYQLLRQELAYPLVSTSGVDRKPTITACRASGRNLAVRLERHSDDPRALADLLRRELVDGGTVLIVRNTVNRALETAAELRQALGPEIPVSVAHSRFMAADRAAKDRWLRDVFGPPNHLTAVGRTRPHCHVVVATQVAEQSLDVDFDVLVTDLAPIDLVLQRIGRMHRHHRPERPPRLATPRCLITGADWDAVPPEPVRGSVRVYDRSALLRAAAVLQPYLDGERDLKIPHDIASLVQTAYGDEAVGPASWQPALEEAAARSAKKIHAAEKRAETFRLGPVGLRGTPVMAWLYAGAGDVDGNERRGRAHVRDDGAETLEVLLVVRRGDQLITPPWLESGGGQIVPTDFAPPQDIARTLLRCALSLPQAVTANGGIDRVIDELEKRNYYPAWEKSPWLGGELVLDLDEQGRTHLTDFLLQYDQHDGLRVERLNPEP